MDYSVVPTPIGRLLLVASARGLVRISFDGRWSYAELGPDWHEGSELLREAAQQLRDYFDGTRRSFTLALAPSGTAFQQRVWDALALIPYGAVESYASVAARIGAPAAVRAVGAANGRNPLPIVVPCHRVIGSDGGLTGFGGGLALKRRLLAHEGADLGQVRDTPQASLPLA
ncbi:MAG TPA: methylated-DNA--[protein]-cysteine S-methyltransferase [Candidatus Saccharimonadia bacterium]|nr:methylated-DNA--[protein]-cysteine S-methyltransferase [Candidatus Saccharimonadia bacterium]